MSVNQSNKNFQAGRRFQKKMDQNNQPTPRPQQQSPKRQSRNLPQVNIRKNITRSENRIRNIKSPFAQDQTKTIANRQTPTKKRALGQIPLRDRQRNQLKVNQRSSQVRKQLQPKVQQRKVIKKVQKKRPNQVNRKNKTRSDIEKVFGFDANERSFF